MTSSISWIDRTGLAETLARFNLAAGGATRRPKMLVVPAPLKLAPRTQSALPRFVGPGGSLRERLDAYIDWLLQLEGGQVAFVIDHDGLPLVDRGADADLLAIASSVMQLVERLNSKLLVVIGQTVILQLDEGRLILISVTTPIGHYTVGHVSRRVPEPAAQQAIAEGLKAAFDNGERRALR